MKKGSFLLQKIKNGLLGAAIIVTPYLAEAQRRPSTIVSPEVLPDNSVIFSIKAQMLQKHKWLALGREVLNPMKW